MRCLKSTESFRRITLKRINNGFVFGSCHVVVDSGLIYLAFLHLVLVNDCGGSLGEWGGFMIAVGE